jgi:SAM-dependent methyltransferase
MSDPIAFHDDPEKDYRRRYRLPDQFVWDEADWARIDFDGYVEVALDLMPRPPARVLDVGCGPGAGAARLLERGYEVTGVDFSDRAIAFAGLMVEGGAFVHGDIRGLGSVKGLVDGFDAAWCIEVLEHVPVEHRPEVFEGVRGRLAAGGVFVLTTPTPRMHANSWDYRRAHLGELRTGLEAAGFAVTDLRFQHRLTPWFSPSAWRLVSNSAYDLRFARHALRRAFLRRWNRVADEARAGRVVIRAERTS